MKTSLLFTTMTITLSFIAMSFNAIAKEPHEKHHSAVSDQMIAEQRANLEKNTQNKGFGPQSPRDLNSAIGTNTVKFSQSPAYSEMNLCNIHFHKNAEHSGGEFTTYAGNGDGMGFSSGFKYDGNFDKADLMPTSQPICPSKHGGLMAGDTIEVHYVHSTAQVTPGPTLGACLSESISNPQLRVETQVFTVINNTEALDFTILTQLGVKNGYQQALHIPSNTGDAINYIGSTTGPSYNEKGSPLQVSWSVRPKVVSVNIESVGKWCESNVFDEDHAHGVRNLVTNPKLLSAIN